MGKFTDLTGQRFGRLIVVGFSHIGKNHHSHFNCMCDCGKEKIVVGKNLVNGNTKSCGCLPVGGGGRLESGESALNCLYGRYKYRAKKRNLPFDLNLEIFSILTKQDCYYCGMFPSQIASFPGAYGEYIYNGIDRIDSSIGYTVDNCVPCCGRCNQGKNDVTQFDFFDWIKKVYNHLAEKGEI